MTKPNQSPSDTPFRSFVREYIKAGWDVVPLPPKAKRHPPTGWTGRKNKGKFADEIQVQRWLKATSNELNPDTGKRRIPWALGNIAVHPGRAVENDGNVWEIMGIDIDDYGDKVGWSETMRLEKELGPLPDTWTSSARQDLRSGIRWFLVPYGFEFKGKVADSIEVVQHVHRYGVVYPSYNPDAKAQYYWYEPGQRPNGRNYFDGVPKVTALAVLPESWFKYLLKGVRQTGLESIDEESTTAELTEWARNVMGGNKSEMCLHVKNGTKKWLREFKEGGDHHDPLVNIHWWLCCMGTEGHRGARTAMKAVETAWMKRLESEGDSGERTLWIAQSELLRSREGALRKVKARIEDGTRELELDDPCAGGSGNGGQQNTALPPSLNYERNEDGNAQHFLDLHGSKLRFVPNHPDGGKEGKWLVYLEDSQRWVVDTNNTLVRNMFREVKQRQMADAQANLLAQLGNQATMPEAKAWMTWARESGNKMRVTNSLAQATTFPSVTVNFEALDNDPYLLPVANGLIRFYTKTEREAGKPAFEFIDPSEAKGYMVTQNTHVPYIPYREQKTHSDPTVRSNYQRFAEQMRIFLENHMSQAEWEYTLRLLGFSILGINPKKAIFLVGERDTGKSTFQNMMNAALGDLSIWREPLIFEDTPFKPALAEALTKRVCMVGELGEKHMDAGLFKRITGNDEVSCNLKNVNRPVTLRARCTIISGCNDAPDVPNVDEATKSRFVVIPFRHQVTSSVKDVGAQDELMQSCRVPLLAMLIEQCAIGISEGIQDIPQELALETRQFVAGLSEIGDFVNDVLVQCDPADWDKYARNDQTNPLDPKPRWPDELCVGTKDMWNAYLDYADTHRMERISSHMLTKRLKGHGLIKDGSFSKANQRRWIGVRLKKGVSKVNKTEPGRQK